MHKNEIDVFIELASGLLLQTLERNLRIESPGIFDEPGNDLDLLVLLPPGREEVVPAPDVAQVRIASAQQAANLAGEKFSD